MSEETWFRYALFALTILVVAPAGCVAHQNAQIRAMVDGGADPIEAGCAVSRSDHDPICAVAASRPR